MIKMLKLVAIFCAIAGALILALNWGSIFTPKTDADKYASDDLIDIGEKCNEIRSDWSKSAGWDELLYNAQRADIDQSKNMGMFSKEGFNTVNNCLRENATNKACDGYDAALHNTNFDAAKLQAAYTGVQYIKSHEQLEGESRILQVEKLHTLYRNVDAFVRSKHPITPKFDAEEDAWRSFAAQENGILATAQRYRTDALFKEMAHIPGFQSGLSEEMVKKLTQPQRKNFYETLSQQIVDYFEAEEITDENIERLDKVVNAFTKEEGEYGVRTLATFKVNYRK